MAALVPPSLQNAYAEVPMGVVVLPLLHHAAGRHVWCNMHFRAMTGYSLAEISNHLTNGGFLFYDCPEEFFRYAKCGAVMVSRVISCQTCHSGCGDEVKLANVASGVDPERWCRHPRASVKRGSLQRRW